MIIAITTIYVLNCFFLLMVVLLQAGRGGGLSLAGGGGSAQVFGSRGATTVLQKLTVWSAGLFMALSMVMASMSSVGSRVEEGTFADVEAAGITSTTGDEAPAAAPVDEAPAAAVPTQEEPAAAPPAEAAPADGLPTEAPAIE
ncbi:MAG: preprotein translocase subunit SecG [Bradymonadia bacterium]|jgi:preprotein translocase subunit SecG